MPSSDTSYTERIRRLKARVIAQAVANGTPLQKGTGYEALDALKLGHSAQVVETPGGPVTVPGCGCAPGGGGGNTLVCVEGEQQYTATTPADLTVNLPAEAVSIVVVAISTNGCSNIEFLNPPTVPVTGGGTYTFPSEEYGPECYPLTYTFNLACSTSGRSLVCGKNQTYIANNESELTVGLPPNAVSLIGLIFPTSTGKCLIGDVNQSVEGLAFYRLPNITNGDTCVFPVTFEYTLVCGSTGPGELQCGGSYNYTAANASAMTVTVPTGGAYLTNVRIDGSNCGGGLIPAQASRLGLVRATIAPIIDISDNDGTYTIPFPVGCDYPVSFIYTLLCLNDNDQIVLTCPLEDSKGGILIPLSKYEQHGLYIDVPGAWAYQVRWFGPFPMGGLGPIPIQTDPIVSGSDAQALWLASPEGTEYISIELRCGVTYELPFNCETSVDLPISVVPGVDAAIAFSGVGAGPWYYTTQCTQPAPPGQPSFVVTNGPFAQVGPLTIFVPPPNQCASFTITDLSCGPITLQCSPNERFYTANENILRTVNLPADARTLVYTITSIPTSVTYFEDVTSLTTFTFEVPLGAEYPITYRYTLSCDQRAELICGGGTHGVNNLTDLMVDIPPGAIGISWSVESCSLEQLSGIIVEGEPFTFLDAQNCTLPFNITYTLACAPVRET